MLSPDKFIPIAERSRQIVHIGEWVLRQACVEAKDWHQQGLPEFNIAINLSAVQFSEAGLAETIATVIDEVGIRPELLELEITESVIMKDVGRATIILKKLSALGVALSIDDFGTGHSSLNYLRQFPIQRIKIDKSFVDGVGTDDDSATIVRSIISLGHSLGMEVTAEGVEFAHQFEFLKIHGCDEVQGFFVSHPLTADNLVARFI